MTIDETTSGERVIERNFGVQPLDGVLAELGLSNHDMVELCVEGLTHKTVQRARKGRRLTPKMKVRVTETLNAWLRAKGEDRHFGVKQLFNY